MSGVFGSLDVDTDWAAATRSSSSPSTSVVPERLDEPAETWPEDAEPEGLADAHVTLPGMGESGKGCGEWAPREFCDTCGEVHLGPHRCQQRGCPDCWSTWATQRAEKVVRRLQSARWAEPDGIERRAVHAVVSPPEGEVRTLADIGRYRRKAHDRAREAGIRGGVCVFHGFRVTEAAKREYRRETEGEATAAGMWRYVRENGRTWRSQTYWSPHYHYVGLATEVEPDEDDEWVVERLSTGAAFTSLRDREAYESLAKIATYIMSHATFEPPDPDEGGPGKKAVSWFGSVHPSNFQAEEELSEGALSVIERLSAEVTGAVDPEGRAGPAEAEKCPEEDCTGRLRSIFEFPSYSGRLDLSREVESRLSTAFEWAIGEVVPPPGMRFPTTEAECTEAFEYLLQ
jgi:ADP-ribose pyrophosphatase YjhB (NUDIX family)